MSRSVVGQQILEQLDQLAPEQQRQVLAFIRSLAHPASERVPGASLLHFAGTIAADDLQAIARAIDDGCERVDRDEW